MDKKTDLVFEYFEQKYGFDIQKLGIDKYHIRHIFQNNHTYFDNKNSIKILILHIEKMIDSQIKDNKNKISTNNFLDKDVLGKDVLGKDVLGKDVLGKDVLNKGNNILGKDIVSIDNTLSKGKDKLISRRILIDSKDRDFSKFIFPSLFSFPLKNPIKKDIEIVEVILRDTKNERDSSDNLENIPYLILDLFLGKPEVGSNKYLEKCSCILGNYELNGEYRYYTLNKKIVFNGKINQLDIKISKPNGEMYNLGTKNNGFIYSVLFLNLLSFE
jgi:hypothetical protein